MQTLVFLIPGTIPAGLGILTLLSPWRYVCFLLSPNIACVPGRLAAVCSDALGTVGHPVSLTGGLCSNPSSNVVLDPNCLSPPVLLLNCFAVSELEKGWLKTDDVCLLLLDVTFGLWLLWCRLCV